MNGVNVSTALGGFTYRQPENRFDQLLLVITFSKTVFSADFKLWLRDNQHVYEAFKESAEKVWASGYRHYSARTIMEVLRHRSNVREISGSYKLNNNRIPCLARLYMLEFPEHAGLFSFRGRGE